MKRLFLVSACLGLAACTTSGVTGSYTITVDSASAGSGAMLADAAVRVLERRIESYGETDYSVRKEQTGSATVLTVEAKDTRVLEALTADVTSPFTISILKEAPLGTAGGMVVEGHGTFVPTGIENSEVLWMRSMEDALPGMGRVEIGFTEAGRALMAKVFKENKGKFIGLFVRDRLMSKMLVETDTLLDSIVITEIPSLEIAETFADDVNVGLHATFTPQP